MASVLEYLGLTGQPQSTPVAQLGINTPLNLLQRESLNYFSVPPNAQAADNNVMAVTAQTGQKFLLTNSNHTIFLNKSTELFRAKSAELKALDQKLISGVLVGVVASTLSFLPLMSYLSWAGWGGALYYMNQRAIAAAEYHEALNLLVSTCNWSLGESINERQNNADVLVKNTAIRAMMTELYPVLTETQVKHLIADDIEGDFAKELQAYETKLQCRAEIQRFFPAPDDKIALSRKSAEFNRCIYGYNRGNPRDFIDAFLSTLPDLYRAAQHGFGQLRQWWHGNNEENSTLNPSM